MLDVKQCEVKNQYQSMVMVSGGSSDPELKKEVKKGTKWNIAGVVVGLIAIVVTILLAIFL